MTDDDQLQPYIAVLRLPNPTPCVYAHCCKTDAHLTKLIVPASFHHDHDRPWPTCCAARYVALNVLVFDEELAAVEARVRQMAEARVDAVIVQVREREAAGQALRGF